MKNKKVIIFLAIVLFLISPFSNRFLSHIFMYSYNLYNLAEVEEREIELDVAAGFYPFNLFYDAKSDFKKGSHLEVYYNLADINLFTGRSEIYSNNSFQNAFYGLYIYNYENNIIDKDTIISLTKFDLDTLVISSIGGKNKADIKVTAQYNETFDNKLFQVYEADVSMANFNHHLKKFYLAYLQYGIPSIFYDGKDFEKIDLKAKLYHYYDGKDNFLYYLIVSNDKMFIKLDEIIKKSKIS